MLWVTHAEEGEKAQDLGSANRVEDVQLCIPGQSVYHAEPASAASNEAAASTSQAGREDRRE